MSIAVRLRGIVAAALLLAVADPAQSARLARDLYQATVFVTGQGEETRRPALARALAAVLVKVSGDLRLAEDPAALALGARAPDFVESFSYRDLLEGIPIHDEQGSRDRPYALTVDFDAAKIDATLRALGSVPWSAPRPELLAVIAVRNGATEFLLAADAGKGRDMREALTAAAERFGMSVTLPVEASFVAAEIAPADIDAIDPEELAGLTRSSGAEIVLFGMLTWNDAELGWTGAWRMMVDDISHRWQVRRVSFDDAFRSAIGGAASILSGHGAPN
ncbi:MAG TPA: DUF2066 domain-containing protein [Bauldia sp.]|nr:DUF2066 domain-containing protein [Bauldia sp.]